MSGWHRRDDSLRGWDMGMWPLVEWCGLKWEMGDGAEEAPHFYTSELGEIVVDIPGDDSDGIVFAIPWSTVGLHHVCFTCSAFYCWCVGMDLEAGLWTKATGSG